MDGSTKWDACTFEPNLIIRWIECHPGTASWVQAIGTLLAIIAATMIPWLIYARQVKMAKEPEERFNSNVRQALLEIRSGIEEFLRFQAECFAASRPATDAPAAAHGLSWRLWKCDFALEKLPQVLSLRAIDILERIRAVEILTTNIKAQQGDIRRAIRGLGMYENSKDILIQEADRAAGALRAILRALDLADRAFQV